MRILGVDPGLTTTGYGVIDTEGRQDVRLIETGVIQPQRAALMPERLATVSRNLDTVIAEHSPRIMVLEKLYAHYKHPSTAFVIGHVRGVICLCGETRGLMLVEHSVKRIRKALIGQGNATKEQARHAVAKMLNISIAKLPLDASDALALAIGYARMQAFQFAEMDR